MDFAFDARTEELRGTLLDFMDEYVYPAEAVFDEQLAARDDVGLGHASRCSTSSGPRPASAGCGTSSCPARTAPA